MSQIAIPQEIWSHELTASPVKAVDWLWHGFIAGGYTTLFTGRGKMGKTTMLSLLLGRRSQGGTLAGLAVKPGTSIVVSEEPRDLWEQRARHCGFGSSTCFIIRPFLTVPRPEEWQALIDRILGLREKHGIDLAVFDPLGPFLRNENQPRSIYEALLPLGALTRAGMAVVMAHHPAKGAPAVGEAPRGSSALLGHVDISMEMRQPRGDPATRRRRLTTLSRQKETPRQLYLELNLEETEYLVIADDANAVVDDFAVNWDRLRGVLEDAPQKLTREDILDEWPEDLDKPSSNTLWRWLSRAVALQQISREGAGKKRDPYRYWLPERVAAWRTKDPYYDVWEEQRRTLNLPFESLRERSRKLGDHTPHAASEIGFPDERDEDDE